MSRDASGVPYVVFSSVDLELLDSVDAAGDLALIQEKRRLLVEYYLSRGVDSPTKIARYLGVSRSTARRYIKQVGFRFSCYGQVGFSEMRGRALAELDFIDRELWAIYEAEGMTSVKRLRVVNRLIRVLDLRLLISGFKDEPRNSVRTNSGNAVAGQYEGVEEKIRRHQRLLELSEELACLVG